MTLLPVKILKSLGAITVAGLVLAGCTSSAPPSKKGARTQSCTVTCYKQDRQCMGRAKYNYSRSTLPKRSSRNQYVNELAQCSRLKNRCERRCSR